MKQTSLGIAISLVMSTSFAGSMGPINEGYDFDGFFVGVQAGALTLLNKSNTTSTHSTFSHNFPSRFQTTAVAFNGNAGYGKMFEQFYLGGKWAVTYAPMNDERYEHGNGVAVINHNASGVSTAFTSTQMKSEHNLQPIYNINAVLGYEIMPHVLPYIEGGVSFTNFAHKVSSFTSYIHPDFVSSSSMAMNIDSYKTGYNLGLGLNYQPHPHWILTTEFSYTSFGTQSGAATGVITDSSNTESMTHTMNTESLSLLAGVTYLW